MQSGGCGQGWGRGQASSGKALASPFGSKAVLQLSTRGWTAYPRQTAAMGIKKKAKTSHENTAADPGPAAATSRREMQGVEATVPVSASAPLALWPPFKSC